MSKEKIGIIGGSGFLGSRLAKLLLNSGHEFDIFDINFDTKKPNNFYLDIEEPKTLHQLDQSNIIINLAAIHRDDIRPVTRYDDVNVQGSINICNEARKQNINKIIFTSSVAIYGFAPEDTDETGQANYFNDYGRTKYLAEKVYKEWQAEEPDKRTLVIVRPTVIFGEGNRGNVYNLLKQISTKRFVMFGNGNNKKSMAYVENVASFLEYSLSFEPGLHIYNYIDKPDFDMNTLVSETRKILFGKKNVGLRLPSFFGVIIGYIADFASLITKKKLPVSSIRVKKFMGTTKFSSSIKNSGFVAPVSLEEGLSRTLNYEFIEDNSDKKTFLTE